MQSRTSRITMAALAALVLAAFTWPAVAQDKAEYAGQASCKMCHNKKTEGAQWDHWQASKHAKAIEALKTPEAKAIAEKAGVKGAPNEAPECLVCHVTAYDATAKAAPAKIKLEEGVQCETCHGPGSNHLVDGKALMLKKDASIDPKKNIVTKPEEKVCTECHNEKSPTWDPARYKLDGGKTAGFDFKQASEKIAHPNPKKAEGAKQ